jgi:hypothetical protein
MGAHLQRRRRRVQRVSSFFPLLHFPCHRLVDPSNADTSAPLQATCTLLVHESMIPSSSLLVSVPKHPMPFELPSVSLTNVPAGLSSGTTYYWRVDAYDTWYNEALSGRTLTFTTL